MTASRVTNDIELSRKEYEKLNASFNKKLVFHLGAEAGFFSEYNNMILAMLYCLENRIRFSLYSSDAFFKHEKGWTDFFLPFCDEETNANHTKYNKRRPYTYKRQSENKITDLIYNYGIGPIVKVKNGIRDKVAKYRYFESENSFYFTHELWNEFHSGAIEKGTFNIPQLDIQGDVRVASQKLIELTWVYNSESRNEIDKFCESINLPDEYIGLHIRGGDKFIETEIHDIKTYIDKSLTVSDCRVAFVLTDDYRVIEQLNRHYPEWDIHTLCDKESRGYYHGNFRKENESHKRNQHLKLFASVDIISKANFFIGTFSSNVGMFLGMRMDRKKCLAVDFDDWVLY